VNVTVLLAGIADPKWPLDGAHPRILSPFDESALEVALKLRDARPDTAITMLLAGAAEDDALARSIAAHRADALRRVVIPEASAWDLGLQARVWQSVLDALPAKPDLVLLGREFGDRDDGAFAPLLAETLGWTFVGLAQEARHAEGGFELMRERGTMEERIAVVSPAVASITNDRRNRLRHPLMKNVMAAKRAPIESVVAPSGTARVVAASLSPAARVARAASCRMLAGSLEEQAGALAEFLAPWRGEP
jgi:electron transfer flavoprotein beta subunit